MIPTITLEHLPEEICLVLSCPSCEKRIPYDGVEIGEEVTDVFECRWCGSQIRFRVLISLEFEISSEIK